MALGMKKRTVVLLFTAEGALKAIPMQLFLINHSICTLFYIILI